MLECDSHSHIAKVSKPAKSSLGIIIVINWIFSLIIDYVISIFTNGSGTNTFKWFFFLLSFMCHFSATLGRPLVSKFSQFLICNIRFVIGRFMSVGQTLPQSIMGMLI